MSYFRFFLFLLSILLVFTACRKERIDVVYQDQEVAPGQWFSDLLMTRGGKGYAVGGTLFELGILATTLDDGITWSVDSINDRILNGLDVDEDGNWLMAGFNGYYYRSADKSLPGQFVRLPIWDQIQGVCHAPDGRTVVVSAVGTDFGAITVFSPTMEIDTMHQFSQAIFAIDCAADGVLHAVGYGIVLRSEDGGMSWERSPVEGDIFRDVHFPREEIGYAVGSSGTIIRTLDGGRIWEKLRNGGGMWVSNVDFRSVYFESGNLGFIAGYDGVLWATNDGGESWDVITNIPEYDYRSVFFENRVGHLSARNGHIVRFKY
jgi:hypothetical protein